MASVKRYILPKSVYSKDVSSAHRGLPTFDQIDNDSPTNYVFGSVTAPPGTVGILGITIRALKEHAGAIEGKFILTRANTDANALLLTEIDSQRSYTLGGSTNQIVGISANAAFITNVNANLDIDEGDTVGFAFDRIAPDAYLSYLTPVEVEIEFDATPEVDLSTPRLSRDTTALIFWREAIRDLQLDLIPLLSFERFDLINRCASAVQGTFFGVVGHDYGTSSEVTESGGSISLAGLRIFRTGGPAKLILRSSTNGLCHPVSMEEYLTFANRSSDLENRRRIVYAYNGELLFPDKGSKLSSYGTLTLFYPRIATPVADDSEKIDLPDGAAVELGILKLRHVLAQRYKAPEIDPRGEMERLTAELYRNYGLTVTQEEIKEKVNALI